MDERRKLKRKRKNKHEIQKRIIKKGRKKG
jgi:hypothetical protein